MPASAARARPAAIKSGARKAERIAGEPAQ